MTPKCDPPKGALAVLRWFCKPEYHDAIEGDLLELFERRSNEESFKSASRKMYLDVLMLFRPGIIRGCSSWWKPGNYAALMLSLRVAGRQMVRKKGSTLTKVFGLALAICTCLLITLYIVDELKVDQHYPDADRIFRIYAQDHVEGDVSAASSFPAPLIETILTQYSDVEAGTRVTSFSALEGPGSNLVRRVDKQQNTYEEGFAYVDQGMLDIFQPPLLHGDLTTALTDPNSVVISQEKAEKYFPETNPLGQTIILNDKIDHPFTITGVLAAGQARSHLTFDFYLSMAEHEFWDGEQDQWLYSFYDCYVKLKPKVSSEAFERTLKQISERYIGPAKVNAGYIESLDQHLSQYVLRIQPIKDLYLKSTIAGIRDGYAHGDIRFVWLFGTIALFVLLLAVINFVNLSVAHAATRAKEVGVRKTLGSSRYSLMNQFLVESILCTIVAFSIAIILAYLLGPFFNQISGKCIDTSWLSLKSLLVLVCGVVGLGLLAGLYPALYLSGLTAKDSVKIFFAKNHLQKRLQERLIVVQFSTGVVLLIATIMIHRQVNFILQKDVGFDKDQIVLLQGVQTVGERIPVLKEHLLQIPEVNSVSVSDYVPVPEGRRSWYPLWVEGRKDMDIQVSAQNWKVDHDYLTTMGLQLLEGVDFNPDRKNKEIIINERLAEDLGLEEPIGMLISDGVEESFTVIGVVKDFHFETLKHEILPLSLALGESPETISINVASKDVGAAVPKIKDVWELFSPTQPMRHGFLDEYFATAHQDIHRMRWVFSAFSAVAIFLACLGLFALTAFIAEQRAKEISIRKVLGASISSIIRLLLSQITYLVALSLCLAIPVSWYLLNRWLQDYSYRVELTADVFILAGLMIMLVTLTTITYQVIKAASVNPIKVMRKE
ncbi:MAG: ABC transporter permease [Saprospiraceae bacterium]|nr:ABC transporter permease [Saprospiraceae bacterium]